MHQDFVDLLRAFVGHDVRFLVVGMGLPPVRIDVLTTISGVTFGEAWPGRAQASFGPVAVPVIGRDAFILNKRASGRARDLGDPEALGE